VQVVDRQQQRFLAGDVEGQPVEAVEHGEAAAVGGLGLPLPAEVEDRSRAGGRAGEGLLANFRVDQCRFEELAHDAERELTLEHGPAPVQNSYSIRGGDRSRLAQQRRLADARSAVDQRHPRARSLQLRDELIELCDLAIALEQGHRRCRAADAIPVFGYDAHLPARILLRTAFAPHD
jgi:hypothetical protein